MHGHDSACTLRPFDVDTKGGHAPAMPATVVSDGSDGKTMKQKAYGRHRRGLQGERVAMQEWVKDTGAKVCAVFEGRDTAGKGGTIKAITERVSPRVFRVVARPRPPSARSRRCISSATSPTFPPPGRS